MMRSPYHGHSRCSTHRHNRQRIELTRGQAKLLLSADGFETKIEQNYRKVHVNEAIVSFDDWEDELEEVRWFTKSSLNP